jgi:hypothetical protein
MEEKEHTELMELKHEALPGYKTIFNVTFIISVVYLVVLFVTYL